MKSCNLHCCAFLEEAPLSCHVFVVLLALMSLGLVRRTRFSLFIVITPYAYLSVLDRKSLPGGGAITIYLCPTLSSLNAATEVIQWIQL